MYCAQCGGQVEAGQRYCPRCGALVGGSAWPETQNVAPRQSPAPSQNTAPSAPTPSQNHIPTQGPALSQNPVPTPSPAPTQDHLLTPSPAPHQILSARSSTLRALGVVLCIFAPLGFVLGQALLVLLRQSPYGTVGAFIVPLSTLPLVALLVAIGAKSFSGPRRGRAAYRYAGVADLLVAAAQVSMGLSLGLSFATSWLLGDLDMSFETIGALFDAIRVLITALLVVAAVLYLVAASKKKTDGEKGAALVGSGILLGVFALVTLINPTGRLVSVLLERGFDVLTAASIASVLTRAVGLLYTAGLVMRAVSLISTKEGAVPAFAAQDAIPAPPIPGSASASPAPDAAPPPSATGAAPVSPSQGDGSAVLSYHSPTPVLAASAIPAAGDGPSVGFAVLSFFFPLIGLILYLVWKDSNPLKAKSCGKGALVGVIISAAFGGLAFGAMFVAFLTFQL